MGARGEWEVVGGEGGKGGVEDAQCSILVVGLAT